MTVQNGAVRARERAGRCELSRDGGGGVGQSGTVEDGDGVWDGEGRRGMVLDGVSWRGTEWDGGRRSGMVWDGVMMLDGAGWRRTEWNGVGWGDGVGRYGIVGDGMMLLDGVGWRRTAREGVGRCRTG